MKKHFILTASILCICFAFLLLARKQSPGKKTTPSDEQQKEVTTSNNIEIALHTALDNSTANPALIQQNSTDNISNTVIDNGLIEKASCYLETQGIPTTNREGSIQYTNGLAVIKFAPIRIEGKPLPRAGSYIVTIDVQSGKVIDTKVWR